ASDAESLARFAAEIFGDTFGHSVAPEELQLFLDRAYGSERQRAEIEDPRMVTRLVCEDDAIAGFYQLRLPSAIEPQAGDGIKIEIARFYVERRWHGRGVATPMMNAALAEARQLEGNRVWLTVWEENARAIAFYVKSGFKAEGSTVFLLGRVQQTDLVMARGLDAS
ncbi:MAG: GNAT family N-acetyltransferase, partial [Gemmatimonadaceae bacterium]